MDLERARILLDQVAELLPAEGGKLLVEQTEDESIVFGDRIGLIRFGVGLARGAYRPPVSTFGWNDAVDTGAQEILSSTDPFTFRHVGEWDQIESKKPSGKLGVSGIAICTLLFVFVAGLVVTAAVGAVQIVRWVFELWQAS